MTDGAHAKGRNEEWLMKNAQQMDEMLTSITKGVGNISRHYRADWDVMSAHTAPRGPINPSNGLARLINCLLRYIDSRPYFRTVSAGRQPSVSFAIYPRRIEVQYNEDGHSDEDLNYLHELLKNSNESSCNLFAAATEITIQSNSTSFIMRHVNGNLVSRKTSTPTTRHQRSPAGEVPAQIVVDLQDLRGNEGYDHGQPHISYFLHLFQPGALVALNQLCHLNISTHDDAGGVHAAKEVHISGRSGELLDVHAVSNFNEMNSRQEVERYMAVSAIVSEIPICEDDAISDKDRRVVLVFPLSSDGEPLEAGQPIYSPFLVEGGLGLKFIIHTDFVIGQDGHEVEWGSVGNEVLIDAFADAFVKSISIFCRHPTLQYTWPRYLPQPGDSDNPLQHRLAERIRLLVSEVPLLQSHHSIELRKISEMTLRSEVQFNKDGTQRRHKTAEGDILAQGYSYGDAAALVCYGLQSGRPEDIIDLVRRDLDSQSSIMKSSSTSQHWHIRAASLITSVLEENSGDNIDIIRKLDLIPLRDGSWTSILAGPIYWPSTADALIPSDINARIVQLEATETPQRRQLFASIGVQEAFAVEVRSSVLNNCRNTKEVTVETCQEWLRFLYMTHEYRRSDHDLKGIVILDQNLRPCWPHTQDVYMNEAPPVSSQKIPEIGTSRNVGNEKHLDSSILSIHPLLLEDAPSHPRASHPSWRSWLSDFVGVRERIKLVSQNGKAISDEFLHHAETQPHLILDTLEYLWRSEGALVCDKPELLDQLKVMPVPTKFGELHPLWETYLPLQHLQRRCLEFMKPNEPFPFLGFGRQPSAEDLSSKWSFLYKDLGVAKNDDLGLLLDILSYIQEANSNGLSIKRCRELIQLYCELERKCIESEEPESARDICRSYIEDISGIAVPGLFLDKGAEWVDPRRCLFDAPLHMMTKFPLRFICEDVLLCDAKELATLSSFFHRTLCVPSMCSSDIIAELVALRDQGCRDLGHVVRLYECLDKINTSGQEHQLRGAFETESLIFVPFEGRPTWVKLSQCIWSSSVEIGDKAILDLYYPNIEGLFVQKLGVEQLTVDMVYQKLLHIGVNGSPPEELHRTLGLFNFLLQQNSEAPDLGNLLQGRIFPVRNTDNSNSIVSAETDFVIVDRQHVADAFAGRARMLDMGVEQVRQMKPFLQWAGLEGRFLSMSAKETTFVGAGVTCPISCASRDIKRKSHALLRIASAFNSPRFRHDHRKLYRLLSSAQVLESDSIFSIQTIVQDGRPVTSRTVKSDLHINDDDDEEQNLIIHVPHDKQSQDVCFATVLPGRLAEWLMRDPSNTNTMEKKCADNSIVAAIGSMLYYDVPVLDRILEKQGIGHVNFAAEDAFQSGRSRRGSATSFVHSPLYERDIFQWHTPPKSDSSNMNGST